MWTMPLFVFDYSVTVSVRWGKQSIVLMVDQSNNVLWQTPVWCLADRMPQPKLTRAIVNDFGHYPVPWYSVSGCTTVLVDVLQC